MNDDVKAARESIEEFRDWACRLNQMARHAEDGMANSLIAADNQRAIWVKVKFLLAHIDGEAARTAAAVAAAREEQVWLMSPEAAKRLDAYRELAEKCAALADERDALRAQVSELEEYKQEGDDVEVAAQRLRFWAENPYACPVHFGARTACGQCYDSERALRRSTEAQVEAARAECMRPHSEDCTSDGCAPGCVTPDSILAAMDGAKP